MPRRMWAWLLTAAAFACASPLAHAQIPPSAEEIAVYSGLHAAAAGGDTAAIERAFMAGGDVEARDIFGRTPLMVAAYRRDTAGARTLLRFGANPNALENQSYDLITIAAVLDDLDMLTLAIASGGNTRAVTSPYHGTALIAAAHLGHVDIVSALIAARAPLDHVNSLGWTALIEAIVLGDGGDRHQATVAALIAGGADLSLADRQGVAPLTLARRRGFTRIAQMLEQAGAKP
jgi:uncharacterized protein